MRVFFLKEPNRPWSDMQWGLCCCDDVIEHTGPDSWALKDFFLSSFARAMMHQQNDIRQTAIYGVGIIAMCGGPNYTSSLADFVQPLIQVIETPDSRSDDNNLCTENAISAMTKVDSLFTWRFHTRFFASKICATSFNLVNNSSMKDQSILNT